MEGAENMTQEQLQFQKRMRQLENDFSGHIACDSASRSEIVIPIHCKDAVAAVLDIDSPEKGRFSEEDRKGLEQFVFVLEETMKW